MEALYTCIPHHLGLEAVNYYLEEDSTLPPITTSIHYGIITTFQECWHTCRHFWMSESMPPPRFLSSSGQHTTVPLKKVSKWMVFWPTKVPNDHLGPLGLFDQYLVKNHYSTLFNGFWVAWLIHVAEAAYSLRLCRPTK